MVKISVAVPFTLSHDDGEVETFGVGQFDVDETVAGHWYVKAHLAPEDAGADASKSTKARKAKATEATGADAAGDAATTDVSAAAAEANAAADTETTNAG